jgi:hypothetical protein
MQRAAVGRLLVTPGFWAHSALSLLSPPVSLSLSSLVPSLSLFPFLSPSLSAGMTRAARASWEGAARVHLSRFRIGRRASQCCERVSARTCARVTRLQLELRRALLICNGILARSARTHMHYNHLT